MDMDTEKIATAIETKKVEIFILVTANMAESSPTDNIQRKRFAQ